MRALSDTEVRVAAADFRLLSRTALNALLQMKEQHRFVRGMVQWLGFRVTECPFQPEERQAGKSKYTLRRMLRLASDGLFSFSRVPLRAPMWGSGVFFAAALVHAALAISSGLQASGTAGWNYLMLVLHLGIGSVLASLGIVGEYVGRVHEQGKQRPVYLLKDCRLAALDHVHQRRDAA
jgi:dolichol-phosphate mannosyltransferase